VSEALNSRSRGLDEPRNSITPRVLRTSHPGTSFRGVYHSPPHLPNGSPQFRLFFVTSPHPSGLTKCLVDHGEREVNPSIKCPPSLNNVLPDGRWIFHWSVRLLPSPGASDSSKSGTRPLNSSTACWLGRVDEHIQPMVDVNISLKTEV